MVDLPSGPGAGREDVAVRRVYYCLGHGEQTARPSGARNQMRRPAKRGDGERLGSGGRIYHTSRDQDESGSAVCQKCPLSQGWDWWRGVEVEEASEAGAVDLSQASVFVNVKTERDRVILPSYTLLYRSIVTSRSRWPDRLERAGSGWTKRYQGTSGTQEHINGSPWYGIHSYPHCASLPPRLPATPPIWNRGVQPSHRLMCTCRQLLTWDRTSRVSPKISQDSPPRFSLTYRIGPRDKGK